MIEAGAMDAGDVEALADRLGVGERQLRRLFAKHIGASPVAVAQTRRVLLAKQLIVETRLPMTDVALAAGFGSVRRFNETFRQLFDRPPATLRHRDAEDLNLGGAAITLKLAYKPPYDWGAMATFLQARAVAAVETASARRYARTFSIDGRTGAVRVEPGEGAFLQVTVSCPDLGVLPLLIARVRRVFDLSIDPAVVGAHLSEDPRLAALVARRPGLRAPGAWDGFEIAVRAVLGQQVTVRAARTLAGRLVQAFGEPLSVAPSEVENLTHVFPGPARLVNADIGAIGMPRARAASINRLAAAALDNPMLFEPRGGLDEAIAVLRRLPGIGDWTAHYIALRALREPDAFPAADVALMRSMAGPDGSRPTAAELEARAERWRPWRAYAAQHLWAADADPKVRDDNHANTA